METMKKRALSLILALVLALSLLPISVLATEGTRKEGDIVFTGSADTQPAEKPGKGFQWMRDETQDKTDEKADCGLVLHAHSADCVTGAEKIGKKAYEAGIAGANKDAFFAVEQFNYYKLNCGKADGEPLHVAECYTGKQGDLTPFRETGVTGWVRKIGDNGDIYIYVAMVPVENSGWYRLTCTTGGLHVHNYTGILGEKCFDETSRLADPVIGTERNIGRALSLFGTNVDTLDLNDLKDVTPTPCMYRKATPGKAWYALDCAKAEHIHHHSDTCYTTEGATAGDYDKKASAGFQYLQCTTPTHAHSEGCYKIQYAWVLVSSSQKTIQLSYAWAGAKAAVDAVQHVKLPKGGETVIDKAAVEDVPTASIDGYEISRCWYTDETCKTEYKSFTQLVGKAITLYAQVTAVETHTYQVNLDCYTVKNGNTFHDKVSETLTRRAATEPTAAKLLADVSPTAAAPKDTKIGKNNVYTRGTELADFKSEGDFAKNELVFTVRYYRYEQPKPTGLTISVVLNGLDPADYAKLTKASNKADAQSLRYSFEASVERTQYLDWTELPKTYYSSLPQAMHTLAQYNAEVPGYQLKTTYVGTGNAEKDASEKDGYQIDIKSGDNGTITIINTYTKNPATTGTLILEKEFAGDLPATEIPKALSFTLSCEEPTFVFIPIEIPYSKLDNGSYTTNELQPGMYTITENNAMVDGYTLSTKYSWEDADPVTDGYQVEVVAQAEPTVATITNTYVGKQYRLVFEAGDYGVMRDGGTENDPDPDSTFTWKPNDDGTYAWQRETTGKPASQKTWTYRFTKSQVTENPAMRSGNQASAPNPAINASSGNTFQGYYLLGSDGSMSDTAYDTGNTEGILGGGLYAAYTAMEAAGTDSLIYRAKYNVSTPVDPTPTPTPDPDPNPGSGGDYEPQNPATPPVTTLPDGETPLADLPDSETPLANLPDEETPLADLPDEETPLADAPKTGDSVGIWAALLGVSGMAIAGLTLGKRKKTEEN